MELIVDIPDEFLQHFEQDRFADSLRRLQADAHCLAGKYEQELCDMLVNSLETAQILVDGYAPPPSGCANDVGRECTSGCAEKYYLFVFGDDSRYEMKRGVSFKDALWEMTKYTGDGSSLFCKALKGFDSNDVEGIIGLYEQFSSNRIEKVYIVSEEIFAAKENNGANYG